MLVLVSFGSFYLAIYKNISLMLNRQEAEKKARNADAAEILGICLFLWEYFISIFFENGIDNISSIR